MSAFVVTDQTINKVVSQIYSLANGPDSSIAWKETKLYKMGFDVFSSVSCAELADKMFALNVEAVNARYGKGGAEKFRQLDFKYRFTPATLINTIKALESWKYQCTEGSVPKLALYEAMAEVRCLLCIEYAHRRKEYEAATWD